MDIIPPKKIKIIEINNRGRGVIATEKIFKNEIIEYCPILILSKKENDFIKNKSKSDTLYYYFLQQPELNRNCLMLGYGSLYNHSLEPNAEIDFEEKPEINYIFFRAMKDIEVGEEITWDYYFDDGIVEFLSAD